MFTKKCYEMFICIESSSISPEGYITIQNDKCYEVKSLEQSTFHFSIVRIDAEH